MPVSASRSARHQVNILKMPDCLDRGVALGQTAPASRGDELLKVVMKHGFNGDAMVRVDVYSCHEFCGEVFQRAVHDGLIPLQKEAGL